MHFSYFYAYYTGPSLFILLISLVNFHALLLTLVRKCKRLPFGPKFSTAAAVVVVFVRVVVVVVVVVVVLVVVIVAVVVVVVVVVAVVAYPCFEISRHMVR
jgi:hypothetical protein